MVSLVDEPDVEPLIDLRAILDTLVERRWWTATSILFFASIFVAVAFVATPVYRASTVLVPASAERASLSGSLTSALDQLGGLAALAGVSLGSGDSGTEEALAVLRSRQFTESFIRDKELMPKLFASKWDAAREEWSVDEKDQPTLAKAYKRFDKRIRSVIRDNKTGLVTLQIDWIDRNEAAAWANELVQRLNAEMRSRAIANVDASVGFLEKELESTLVVETREAINRLIEAQIKQ